MVWQYLGKWNLEVLKWNGQFTGMKLLQAKSTSGKFFHPLLSLPFSDISKLWLAWNISPQWIMMSLNRIENSLLLGLSMALFVHFPRESGRWLILALIPGLPVYGGLARSKINEYSRSRTLLSGVSLAFFTFLAAQYLLEPLSWLPVVYPQKYSLKCRKLHCQPSSQWSVLGFWLKHLRISCIIGRCALGQNYLWSVWS